ncbi:MAG: hypothetical protein NTW03_19495, partial [Verrucomicrobia bacterium]|nr:hypothetical protein [Verrucomicrobiota bacterium]
VPTAVSTWGTAIFAYLRHDNAGSIIGTLDPVTHVVTDRVRLGTNFLSAVTFTATDVGYGPNLFYYLRSGRTTLTTNIVSTFAINTVITFTTNQVTANTTNSVVSFATTNIVTATGMDICQARPVTAAADCPGPVAPPPRVSVIAAPSTANGAFKLSFPTMDGRLYTVQYKNALSDPAWTDLETVIGTGGDLPITDATAARQLSRFYRVIVMP